jgi:tRNA-(ms[2]io[6]A)-hydroxylase
MESPTRSLWSDPLAGLPLRLPTSPEWSEVATADLDALLVDHAWCEYKAATAGLGLIARYPEHPGLVRPMLALAQEEMLHFRQCLDRLRERGRELGVPPGDRYVQALRARFAREGRGLGGLGDTLHVNAINEARSCERFRLLALALLERPGPDGELGEFYGRLADAEGRHWETFRDLAVAILGDEGRILRRIEAVADMEAEVVAELPLAPRMH